MDMDRAKEVIDINILKNKHNWIELEDEEFDELKEAIEILLNEIDKKNKVSS